MALLPREVTTEPPEEYAAHTQQPRVRNLPKLASPRKTPAPQLAMLLADQIEHMVLFSGDGDFARLVAAIQQRGKRVTVVSTLASKPRMVADELRRQADQFADLVNLEPLVALDQRSP